MKVGFTERHARFLTVTPVDEALAIAADRRVLAAVVANLLQNAFKFTRPGTTVTLRVGASAERVLIEVQDECGGLPSGDGNELFRPFEQRSADRTGIGLGLAFSRWGAEANEGRIYRATCLGDDACSPSTCRASQFRPSWSWRPNVPTSTAIRTSAFASDGRSWQSVRA